MVIETSPALGGEGEAAEAREALRKRGSKIASCLPLTLAIQRQLGEKSEITTPIEVVTVGAWPGWGGSKDSTPKVGQCSYNISLSQIS